MIGVTSVTIGNWERGVRQPSFELLPKLADALDTSIDALLGKSRQSHQSKVEEELLRNYRQLDSHGQKLVRIICNTELERIRPHKAQVIRFPTAEHEDVALKKHNRYIPFYYTPPAAGIAVPLETDEFEMLLADDSIPSDADYSMFVHCQSETFGGSPCGDRRLDGFVQIHFLNSLTFFGRGEFSPPKKFPFLLHLCGNPRKTV